MGDSNGRLGSIGSGWEPAVACGVERGWTAGGQPGELLNDLVKKQRIDRCRCGKDTADAADAGVVNAESSGLLMYHFGDNKSIRGNINIMKTEMRPTNASHSGTCSTRHVTPEQAKCGGVNQSAPAAPHPPLRLPVTKESLASISIPPNNRHIKKKENQMSCHNTKKQPVRNGNTKYKEVKKASISKVNIT
ncbi:hypothetical protein CAPTEDRAFT_198444 [Capitella teleta]|uniref:Uncharacterized protein n=1 Tax=Capitella teleta TaxID=283909 RepID=R7TVL5_CAPTE|nr:hypothetical protein CAPTEDRAFT_198444 [Capitella teleta]|eukprot:ELT97923.1 hypothetical protein CAPTEDRAFT_198444 [Capitella teleta]